MADNFFSNNADWLAPVLDFIGGTAGSYIRGDTRGDYFDILNNQRQTEYDDGKRTYDAYLDYLGRSNAAAAANRAASSRNANARAAAAAQTERNRQRAASKAFKIRDKVFEEQAGLFKPYQEAGLRLLPQVEGAYSTGLKNIGMLSDYLNQPDQIKKLSQSKPATSVNLKLPTYLQGGKPMGFK